MEKLTKAEEPIMQIVWRLNKAFVNDIIDKLPDPQPPYNTVSSIVRILENKGLLGHETFGRTHCYFPLVSKTQYRNRLFRSMIKEYFDGSYSELMSFILKEDKLSKEEQEELKEILKKHYDE